MSTEAKHTPKPVVDERNAHVYRVAYKRLQRMTSGKQISPASVLILVALATQIVQNLARGRGDPLTSREKKQLVERMCYDWVDDTEMPVEDKLYFRNVFLPNLLGGFIDSAVDLNLNHVARSGCDCLFSCRGAKGRVEVVDQNVSE